MRISKACLQCRTGKRKCPSTPVFQPCSPCVQRRLSCSNHLVRPHRRPPGPSSSSPQTQSAGASECCDAIQHPYTDEIIHLVDLYFEYIHDKPHTLFHKASFKASVLDGSVSRTILLSMIALSARFAKEESSRALGPVCAVEAVACYKADMERVCIENIQASIIIANIFLSNSDKRAESLYYALAIRMAQMLDLATTIPTDDAITREIKRRIWWTCFLVDVWSSGGSSLSRQLSAIEHRPRLPMNELVFWSLRPGSSTDDIPDTAWQPGIWSHMLGMIETYRQIQDLIRYLVKTTDWDETFIETTVTELTLRLEACEANLEPQFQFSRESLVYNARCGTGRLYTGFHLGYQYYCMLLFYQYLDRHRPQTKNGAVYAERCKVHARRFCDILRMAREVEGAEAMHNIIAHITVVSSSVLLHTYMFGEQDELEDVKLRLESNMEALARLRKYWPSAELMITRLVVFLKNCVGSANPMTSNTYRFDRWMVRFLQEYGTTLDEKDDSTMDPIPQTNQYGLDDRSQTIQNVISGFQDA